MPLDDADITRLKDIFVTRKECDTITDEINKGIASDRTELAVIKSQLKTITWILTAVGGGIITMLVKMFFGG